MADEVEPCAMRRAVLRNRLAGPAERAGERRQQTRHDAQEARLAAPVGTAENQAGARLQGEAEAPEDQALAAPAGQRMSGEQNHGAKVPGRGGTWKRRLRRRGTRSRREGLG